MNAYELCQRHVVTIRRHEDLSTAAWMMRERNVGCLVVVDSAEDSGGWIPVGLLSDREIVVNVIAQDCDPRNVMVEDVMDQHPLTVGGNTSLEDTMRQMRAAKARRVLVVDDNARLCGILKRDDILEQLARGPQPVPVARPDLRLVESARF